MLFVYKDVEKKDFKVCIKNVTIICHNGLVCLYSCERSVYIT